MSDVSTRLRDLEMKTKALSAGHAKINALARKSEQELRRRIDVSDREWVSCPLDFYDALGDAATASAQALVDAKSYTDTKISTISLTALLDAQFGAAQGGVLYRAAAGWAFLPPGAPGDKLTSGGPGADVSWAP